MSITIGFACRSSANERNLAARNLLALLSELAVAQLVLLDELAAEVEFDQRDAVNRIRWKPKGRVTLNLDLFSRFSYQRSRKPADVQRCALAELTRGTVAVLDMHLGFTSRREYRKRIQLELAAPNARMQELRAAQYLHGDLASSTLVAQSGYRSLLDKLVRLIDPMASPARRLLVDVFLVRDHLRRSSLKPLELESLMNEGFPNTYPLLREFDIQVEHEATQSAIRRHPELSSDPAAALRFAFRNLQIIWHPEDASIDSAVTRLRKPR